MKFTQPWGFSKLDTYRACPKKFAFQFIDKLPQPSSDAMARGSTIHEELESYLNGWITDLSNAVVGWKPALDKLKASNFKSEQAIGLDKNWNMLPDWFDKATWLRVKMDAYYIEGDSMTVIDFKTGKYRVPSEDQIELYAVTGLSINPGVKTVTASFWFIDTDDTYNKVYTADELQVLRKKYEEASAQLYTEEQWAPAPSKECRWCPYSKTKGGKCAY